MIKFYFSLSLVCLMISCGNHQDEVTIENVNWEKRKVSKFPADSTLEFGKTYLSVYSQVYSQNEHNVRDLTVTVSMRNTSEWDTVYVERAECFDTHGKSLENYFSNPIYIAPLETIEIIIDENDPFSGTGGNFIFDWKAKKGVSEPLFESVMISTASQQGISFTTSGKRIR